MSYTILELLRARQFLNERIAGLEAIIADPVAQAKAQLRAVESALVAALIEKKRETGVASERTSLGTTSLSRRENFKMSDPGAFHALLRQVQAERDAAVAAGQQPSADPLRYLDFLGSTLTSTEVAKVYDAEVEKKIESVAAERVKGGDNRPLAEIERSLREEKGDLIRGTIQPIPGITRSSWDQLHVRKV